MTKPQGSAIVPREQTVKMLQEIAHDGYTASTYNLPSEIQAVENTIESLDNTLYHFDRERAAIDHEIELIEAALAQRKARREDLNTEADTARYIQDSYRSHLQNIRDYMAGRDKADD